MLRLDLGSVPEGVSHVDLRSDPSDWGNPLEGGRMEEPVIVGLDVTRKGQDLYLKGKASVAAVFECGRCLEEYTCKLEAPVGFWVVIGSAEDERDPEERENVIEVRAGVRYADLTDHIRSELLLQIPFKRICRADCKGLCPECGTNLNEGACKCERDSHDSRWDALKEIKKNL